MEENLPLVSIIIPVYNREALIRETIKSALNQTYPNVEIIIVDNSSTDNTWNTLVKAASTYNNIKIYKNEFNVGPVLNWQKCIDLCEGEFCKIIWSDDLISNNFIEETIRLFDDDTAFIISAIEIFSDTKTIYKSSFQNKNIYNKEVYLKNILIFNRIGFPKSPGCAIFRLHDIKEALLVDIPNDFNLVHKKSGAGNDLLIFLNVTKKYKCIKTTDKATAYFRHHKTSISVQSDLLLYYETAILYFIKKNYSHLIQLFAVKIALKSLTNKQMKMLYQTLPTIKASKIIKIVLKN